MICVGTDLETSKKGVELAKKHNGIWATVGVHPTDVEELYQLGLEQNMDKILNMIEGSEKVVAVGEVGLDYYRTKNDEVLKKQKEVLEIFINVAYQYRKPLILHCRDSHAGSQGKAHRDMLEILNRAKNLLYGGVAHSFTGNLDEAKKYLDLGFYLGFNGIITFAHQYDEVVKYAPLDNILLETDAPFLAPEPYRGRRNEPAYVMEVAKKVAELKSIPLEEVTEKTTKNIKSLFHLF